MSDLLRVGWSWYPSVLIGLGLWSLLYAIAARDLKPVPAFRQVCFHLGTLAALLALVSPLDRLGDDFLFSAHMLQHLLLMFASAPLWLVGIPAKLIDRIIPRKATEWVRRLTMPGAAFTVFVLVLWAWHIPAFYALAQENEAIHIIEHLTFLGAAIVGWWPVARSSNSRFPLPPAPVRMLYLFLLAVPCTLLAALLTFASSPIYEFYVSAPHIFGLDALQDQRLGGLLMWLPTHLVLLAALGTTFAGWFTRAASGLPSDLQKTGV